jgi:DNA adenine methylase
MKITSIAPWFGGKRALASQILRQVRPHRLWVDACCGSLAVTMAKTPATMEIANDLHGDVINLARVLKEEGLALTLYGALNRVLMCEALHSEARAALVPQTDISTPNVERATNYMITAWQGRNGVAGTCLGNMGFAKRFTANGGAPATRWRSVVESIPEWHERLRGVCILSEDLFGLLERLPDDDRTTIYVDPPYVVKGAKYLHDFGEDDHQRLFDTCKRFTATQVLISYYDHPHIRDVIAHCGNWSIRRLSATKALVNQGMRDKGGPVAAPEVLLSNLPLC